MSFSINTNVASLQAQNNLRASSEFQTKTIGRVTSGLRIVQSGDDAAGLAIANGYRSDEAVLTQGIRNANDGLSQLQIADGGINNISQLIDRARTLATQSASGTFTGDRGVLNSEFQNVVGEIDRQATAIGLNQGGTFAKSLSVFIGGGKGTTAANAIANGSVGLDLSTSTVDSKSLGLKGVQAQGNTSVDLSASQATSVQNLVNDITNKASESVSGTTDFYFKGSGFSDSNKVKVSVNLSGVTDPSTLAAALNTAIQNAGNGATSSATAFRNAGISASISTDASGAQHLAFTSSTAAFGVQAGDRTSNALLGNITAPGSTTGASLQTTFAAAGNLNTATKATQAATIKLRVQGADLQAPEDITLSVAKGDTVASVLANLATAVSGNTNLSGAGISISAQANGAPLQFQNTKGENFTVTAGGDAENLLGLGSARLGAANALDYATTTGTAYDPTVSGGTANFEISLNGAAASTNAVAVNLSGGDATAGLVTGANGAATVDTSVNKKLDISVDGTVYNITLTGAASNAAATKTDIAASITTSLAGAGTASVDNTNHIIITSATKGANSSVQILTASATDAGATLGLTGSGAGQSRSGGDLANYLNQQFNQNATLQGAQVKASFAGGQLTIASQNNSVFQLNAFGSGATGAISTSSKAGTYAIVAGTNDQLSFKVDGGSAQTITLAAGGAVTTAALVTDINAKLTAASITGLTASASGGHVVLTSTAGAGHSVQVQTAASNDANATIGFATAAATSGHDANSGFGVAGASFTGNTVSTAPTVSPSVISGGAYQTAGFTFSGLQNGSDSQTINVTAKDASGSTFSQDIVLTNNTTSRNGRSIDEALSAINSKLQQSNNSSLQSVVAVKYDDAGTEKIKFTSATSSFNLTVGGTGSNTGFNNSGHTTSATVQGTGSTSDISSQSTAQTAVGALANAVAALGRSQAVVGRGENQFSYAVNLAQSQLTNTATAESRIRDADLAAEAANLTKAQILLQAGVAALAQANSAPQQILSLLRG